MQCKYKPHRWSTCCPGTSRRAFDYSRARRPNTALHLTDVSQNLFSMQCGRYVAQQLPLFFCRIGICCVWLSTDTAWKIRIMESKTVFLCYIYHTSFATAFKLCEIKLHENLHMISLLELKQYISPTFVLNQTDRRLLLVVKTQRVWEILGLRLRIKTKIFGRQNTSKTAFADKFCLAKGKFIFITSLLRCCLLLIKKSCRFNLFYW